MKEGTPARLRNQSFLSTSVIGLSIICDAILEGPLGWGRDVLPLMA